MKRQELQVAALENGTVIDHIPSSKIFEVINLLHLEKAEASITIGFNLKSKKMGQKILEIGPRWHKSKDGTPTMGGLSFLAVITVVGAVLLAVAYFTGDADSKLCAGGALTLFLAVSNGCVGIFDDWKKLQKKQNEGLTPP